MLRIRLFLYTNGKTVSDEQICEWITELLAGEGAADGVIVSLQYLLKDTRRRISRFKLELFPSHLSSFCSNSLDIF
jgi:hypothetical protein